MSSMTAEQTQQILERIDRLEARIAAVEEHDAKAAQA